jgi:hypothetical protein
MSVHYPATEFAKIADHVDAQRVGQGTDRTFGLPTGLYVATVGLYFAFLAVMAVGFQSAQMGLVIAICVVYVAMAFGVPMMWTRMQPNHQSKAQGWLEFCEDGIMTATGLTKAKDASAQVLILPVLILLWGISTVTIAAMVS